MFQDEAVYKCLSETDWIDFCKLSDQNSPPQLQKRRANGKTFQCLIQHVETWPNFKVIISTWPLISTYQKSINTSEVSADIWGMFTELSVEAFEHTICSIFNKFIRTLLTYWQKHWKFTVQLYKHWNSLYNIFVKQTVPYQTR